MSSYHSGKAYITPSIKPLCWCELQEIKKRDKRLLLAIIRHVKIPLYSWTEQSKDEQLQRQNKTQDKWTLSFPLPRKLCDVFIMWHESFSGDKWDLCSRMSFWGTQKSTWKQSSKDMSSSILPCVHVGALDVPGSTYLQTRACICI